MCLTTRFKKEERTCACHCKTRIDLQRLSTRKFFSLTNLTLPTTTLCLCFVCCFTLVCYLLALPCNKYRLKFFSSSSFAIMTFCIHAYVWSLSLFISNSHFYSRYSSPFQFWKYFTARINTRHWYSCNNRLVISLCLISIL